MKWRITIPAALLSLLSSAAYAQGESPSHYELTVAIDAAADVARISGEWRLPAGAEATQTLTFLLSPLASDPQLRATCGGAELPIAGHSQADEGGDRRWSLLFGAACPPERALALSFHYEYAGTAAPQLRIARDEGFAGGGGELWYPQQSFAAQATAVLTIDAPTGIERVATGNFADERAEGERTLTRFRLDTPGKLAFAYGQYRIVMRGRSAVLQLARSLEADTGAVAEVAASAVAALTDAFGALPHQDLRIVEVDFRSQLSGTNEPGMLFVDPTQMREAKDELTYWAHELAHQWWGVSVRPFASSPGAAMLTEGMAQYGALLALERVEGAEQAAFYRQAGRDQNTAPSFAGYRALVAEGGERPIATFVPQDQAEVLHAQRLATSKGAIAIDGFARQFGREELHASLRAFLERHRGGQATWTDLEADLARAFGPDARHYLDAWFHQTGWPAE